jgi:UDPglucose 6-dehydrogenase
VKTLLTTPTVIDLRNIYKPEDMSAAGFYYVSIGRSPVEPSDAAVRRQAKREGAAR